ncbi:hypothetical protein SESBI_50871 [Sesbania bispinosa]|nr:hypothetical protein SESBI_50871 [Sesbania bispinosa]
MNPIPHGKSTLHQINNRSQKSSVDQSENPKPTYTLNQINPIPHGKSTLYQTKILNQINPTPNQSPEPKIIRRPKRKP